MKIKVVREDKGLPLPEYQHKGEDACVDLMSTEDAAIKPLDRKLIKTGIRVEVPKGYEGVIKPRSGLALDHGVFPVLGEIDPGYRGEIGVLLVNLGKKTFEINRGDRIAQFVINKVEQIEWDEVEELEVDTQRGEGGFGHTGK